MTVSGTLISRKRNTDPIPEAGHDPVYHRDLEKIRKLTDDIQKMEKNVLKLQQSITSKEALESDKVKLAKENDRLLKLTEDRIALERRLATLVNSETDISKLLLNRNESRISAADLMAAYEAIVGFENAVSIRGVDNYKEAIALLRSIISSILTPPPRPSIILSAIDPIMEENDDIS